MYGVTVLARSGSSRFLCPSATYWHGCIDSRFYLPYPTAISSLPQNLPLYSPRFSLLYPTIFSPLPHDFLSATPRSFLSYSKPVSPLFTQNVREKWRNCKKKVKIFAYTSSSINPHHPLHNLTPPPPHTFFSEKCVFKAVISSEKCIFKGSIL